MFSSLHKWLSVSSGPTASASLGTEGWLPSSQEAFDDWQVKQHWFNDSVCSVVHQ